jgi:5-methylcytosine-specific restriction protein A
MPVTQGHGNPIWTVDETLLALDLILQHYPRIPGKTSKEVRELSATLHGLPVHPAETRKANFRNPDGVYFKLQNLVSQHPDKADKKGLSHSKTDQAVWDRYHDKPAEVHRLAQSIRAGALEVAKESDTEAGGDDDTEFAEGRLLTRLHRRRERQRGLRKKVLKRARASDSGLRCEACESGPAISVAGTQVEEAMFEAHHLVPLSELGASKTRVSDMALLCANCHRLIHRLCRDEARWLTPGNLRARLGGR